MLIMNAVIHPFFSTPHLLKRKRETTHHSLKPENKWAQPSKRLSSHCSVYMPLPYIQLEACWDLMVHSLYLPKKTKLGTTLVHVAYKIAFLSPLHTLRLKKICPVHLTNLKNILHLYFLIRLQSITLQGNRFLLPTGMSSPFKIQFRLDKSPPKKHILAEATPPGSDFLHSPKTISYRLSGPVSTLIFTTAVYRQRGVSVQSVC